MIKTLLVIIAMTIWINTTGSKEKWDDDTKATMTFVSVVSGLLIYQEATKDSASIDSAEVSDD